ncbi:MAG: extracellular matrix regulator RemB [Christensenellales bacterium]|jgi:hypothetical protein
MLHIGADVTIPLHEVIAILDSAALSAKDTSNFYKRFHAADIITVAKETKCLVLAKRQQSLKLYLSPISCSTLLKRSQLGAKSLQEKFLHQNELNMKEHI